MILNRKVVLLLNVANDSSYDQVAMDIKTAYAYGENEMTSNVASKDGQEGVRSFTEKRKPIWSHTNDQ